MSATLVGYPRIGRRRELKRLVEEYWKGQRNRSELIREATTQRETTVDHLETLGLRREDIPVTFSLYDQVLDTLATLGAVPLRFSEVITNSVTEAEEAALSGGLGIDGYFALARGTDAQPPLEMTKWFDTNYHYLVPEIGPETPFAPEPRRLVENSRSGARAQIVGPITFLALSRPDAQAGPDFDPLSRLADAVEAYRVLLGALADAGVTSVQLDEPILCTDTVVTPERLDALIADAYAPLTSLIDVFVTTPYGDARRHIRALAQAGVQRIHLDLVRGALPTAADLEGANTARIVAGVIDGRNVWKADQGVAAARVQAVREAVEAAGGDPATVGVAPSVSLQHVPYTVADETHLDADLLATLAFAEEKVREVIDVASGTVEATEADAPLSVRRDYPGVHREEVRARVASLGREAYSRAPYAQRVEAHAKSLALPPLPTTTIGSFPQTEEIRTARREFRAGVLDADGYEAAMRAEIDRVIALQEEIGLDVLVHGEAERNDMVQYFGEHLDGFAITKHGWVQSYGSRCTRPSILFGDVSRPQAITVPYSTFAASRTKRPVKGMLTGPVTILAWSFVRDDQPLAQTATQVALALRDEVADLESAGIRIIQVDEPALRELLPLRKDAQADYLDWSVDAFRLATASAAAETQIHTHLCYSEFNEVIDAISDLDADVTTIESARSHGEIVNVLDPERFSHQIGPGVWDIHSPRVPAVEEITALIDRALAAVGRDRLWVNPDCGLKTRAYEETVASLTNLVEATRRVRERLE